MSCTAHVLMERTLLENLLMTSIQVKKYEKNSYLYLSSLIHTSKGHDAQDQGHGGDSGKLDQLPVTCIIISALMQ